MHKHHRCMQQVSCPALPPYYCATMMIWMLIPELMECKRPRIRVALCLVISSLNNAIASLEGVSEAVFLFRCMIVNSECTRFEDADLRSNQHWGMRTRTAAVDDECTVEWNEQFVLSLVEASEPSMRRLEVGLWETSMDVRGHHVASAVFPLDTGPFTHKEAGCSISLDMSDEDGATCGKIYLHLKLEIAKGSLMANEKKRNTSGMIISASCSCCV